MPSDFFRRGNTIGGPNSTVNPPSALTGEDNVQQNMQGSPFSALSGNNPTTSRQPTPSVIQPSEPDEAVGDEPVENNEPAKEEKKQDGNKNKSKGKSSSSKTTFVAVIAIIAILGVIIVLIMAKGGKLSPATGILEDPEPTSSAIVDVEPYVDPFQLDDGDMWIDYGFTYTDEQLARLRAVGYTSHEIESFEEDERDFDELVTQAENARKEYLDETLKPYYEGRSELFKSLEDSTWLGLEDSSEDIPKSIEDFEDVVYEEYTINTDFEKVPARGHQMFLKVYLDKEHSDWVYYECDVYQWMKLEDAGNIVAGIIKSSVVGGEHTYYSIKVSGITIYN